MKLSSRFRIASVALLALAAGCLSGIIATRAYWKSVILEARGMPVEIWKKMADGFPLLSIVFIYLTGWLIVYAGIECWYFIKWLRNRSKPDSVVCACWNGIGRFMYAVIISAAFMDGCKEGIREARSYWSSVTLEACDMPIEEWAKMIDGFPSWTVLYWSCLPLLFVFFCECCYVFIEWWRGRLKPVPVAVAGADSDGR